MAELYAKHWYSANGASPDYFNSCSTGEVGVPYSIFGYQNPKNGSAYVGVYSSDSGYAGLNYREYIQCKLIEPLIAGRKYHVKFFVSLSDGSSQACNNIGMYISDDPIYSSWVEEFNVTPSVSDKESKPITEKILWVAISGDYLANGGEQYLTIGVFLNRQTTSTIGVSNGLGDQPYYFIDDVSVIESYCNQFQVPTAFTPNGDGQNDFFYPIYRNQNIKVIKLNIYNRWGELLYNNPETPWDGTYKGQPQPPDTYNYSVYLDLRVPDTVGETVSCSAKGILTLIR